MCQSGLHVPGKPKLETGLLLAYAAVQASSSWTALRLLQDSIGQGRPLATSFGLGMVAVISAGLVWENTILAAGGALLPFVLRHVCCGLAVWDSCMACLAVRRCTVCESVSM